MLLLKRLSKEESHRPPIEEIQREMADVFLRINVLKRAEGWDDQIKTFLYEKFKKLEEYINKKQYEGKL
jgi:hypothetical protein